MDHKTKIDKLKSENQDVEEEKEIGCMIRDDKISDMKKKAKKTLDRKNTIWNAAAGLVNAAEAVVVLAVITRANGIETAGMFTLAFSLANLFMTVGKFGVRTFQVIHRERFISFYAFLTYRRASVAAMLLISLGYVCLMYTRGRIGLQEFWILFFVCLWYSLEAYEDVCLGKNQMEGNLYLGNQMFILRWVVILGVFLLFDVMTKQIIVSLVISYAAGFTVSLINIFITRKKYRITYRKMKQISGEIGQLKSLFRNCLPLFLSEFAYYYLNNMSKYAMARYQSNEAQAIYGYIAMPVFAIPLLNSFLYQPKLVETSLSWQEGKVSVFKKFLVKQYFLILCIAVICLTGAFLLGIPFLSLLYHVDLKPYKADLLILLVGGSFLAAQGYTAAMLTVIGMNRAIFCCYLGALPIGIAVTYYLTGQFGISGASYGYMISIFILTLIMIIVFWTGMKQKRNTV